MIFNLDNTINQRIKLPHDIDLELCLKREDKIHPFISGNKYRKLIYNLDAAKKLGYNTLLTFGGAFSNHIAAVAFAGKAFGFKSIGVIRGEELEGKVNQNATLQFAESHGMSFKFVSRSNYREKTAASFIDGLKNEFGDFYLIPEGGTNDHAIKGSEEILTDEDRKFDYVCCAVGTGGTISGLINASQPNQHILGFPALKGDFLSDNISKFAKQDNWRLITDYHFGGYAKINEELISFINQFKDKQHISLDPVYTGKLMFGVYKLIEEGFFEKESKILAIHTGGLQGIEGMNARLKQKGLPLIT